MLECVINISEGRNEQLLEGFRDAVGTQLLDLHSDPDHHRSVFTLVGEEAPRALATSAIESLFIGEHLGAHPRLGVVDVVPFIALEGSTNNDALRARNEFAEWAADTHGVPCFFYGEERTLPAIRGQAWKTLLPDVGPRQPHATAGAMCVGIRAPLVAYNLWLKDVDLATTKKIASEVRTRERRTLGLQINTMTQVSMNLIEPMISGPSDAFDAVAEYTSIHRAELVGLLPAAVLANIPRGRWETLDLSVEKTIEWRLTSR